MSALLFVCSFFFMKVSFSSITFWFFLSFYLSFCALSLSLSFSFSFSFVCPSVCHSTCFLSFSVSAYFSFCLCLSVFSLSIHICSLNFFFVRFFGAFTCACVSWDQFPKKNRFHQFDEITLTQNSADASRHVWTVKQSVHTTYLEIKSFTQISQFRLNEMFGKSSGASIDILGTPILSHSSPSRDLLRPPHPTPRSSHRSTSF